MDNIKIVRMHSGEDIMAELIYTESEGFLTLKNPMSLFFKRLPTGKSMMVMMPWIPMEIIEQNFAVIHDGDVITIFEPKNSLIQYYNKTLEDIYLKMEQTDAEVEESLLSDDEEDNFISDDIEESVEETINNVFNKRTIH